MSDTRDTAGWELDDEGTPRTTVFPQVLILLAIYLFGGSDSAFSEHVQDVIKDRDRGNDAAAIAQAA